MRLPGLGPGPGGSALRAVDPTGPEVGFPCEFRKQGVAPGGPLGPLAVGLQVPAGAASFTGSPSRLLPCGWAVRWPVPLTGHSACVLGFLGTAFLPHAVFRCPRKETSACPVSQGLFLETWLKLWALCYCLPCPRPSWDTQLQTETLSLARLTWVRHCPLALANLRTDSWTVRDTNQGAGLDTGDLVPCEPWHAEAQVRLHRDVAVGEVGAFLFSVVTFLGS